MKQNKQELDNSFRLHNYQEYHYGFLEWLLYASIGSAILAVTAWIFYRSLLVIVIAVMLGCCFPHINKPKLIEKRQSALRLQFKDMLYYLGASLSAGKSVEQSFVQVYSTLKSLYPSEKSDIVRETDIILHRLRTNENIEDILKDFAVRSGVDEIHHFADVFSVCKRTGGNLVEVIRITTRMISERIEIKHEIESGLAGKKQEQIILSFSPMVLILFVSGMSQEFMEPLFTTLAGRVVMTIALFMIGLGIWISNRIMNIRF